MEVLEYVPKTQRYKYMLNVQVLMEIYFDKFESFFKTHYLLYQLLCFGHN